MTPAAERLAAGATSFRYSFPFLPARRRRDLRTVYAFCRATDDIADDPAEPEVRAGRLDRWEEDLRSAMAGSGGHALLAELARVARARGIPPSLFHDLVRGVRMDVAGARYRTFAELEGYCRLVASAVGRMCLGVFDRRLPRTERYADALGIALQLTNIIRDVGDDAAMGRLYLPGEDLETFGVRPEEVLRREDSDRFRRLMAFQGERAERYYDEAERILEPEDAAALRPAVVMGAIYRRTLRKIRASGFDVLARPIRLSRLEQIAAALRAGFAGRRFRR